MFCSDIQIDNSLVCVRGQTSIAEALQQNPKWKLPMPPYIAVCYKNLLGLGPKSPEVKFDTTGQLNLNQVC